MKKKPYKQWSNWWFVTEATPRALYAREGRSEVEIPLDGINTVADLVAELERNAHKRWFRDAIVQELANALKDIVGLDVRMSLRGKAALQHMKVTAVMNMNTEGALRPDLRQSLVRSLPAWREAKQEERVRAPSLPPGANLDVLLAGALADITAALARTGSLQAKDIETCIETVGNALLKIKDGSQGLVSPVARVVVALLGASNETPAPIEETIARVATGLMRIGSRPIRAV